MFMYYINYDNLPPSCRFIRLHKSVLDYFHNITGHYWAFATVASVESLICIMTGNPFKKISVQHVIDCYPDYKKDSTWGKPSLAFDYIINNNGGKMYWEVDYPRNHNNTQGPCAVQGKKPAVRIIRYEAVLGNERQLLEVVKRRPVIAGVVANSILKGGPKDRTIIRYKDVGGDDKLDHCVLIIGYGSENGVDFWLCQNFWGPHQREDGYFRIERNVSDDDCGTAGIATRCYYPVMEVQGASKSK